MRAMGRSSVDKMYTTIYTESASAAVIFAPKGTCSLYRDTTRANFGIRQLNSGVI